MVENGNGLMENLVGTGNSWKQHNAQKWKNLECPWERRGSVYGTPKARNAPGALEPPGNLGKPRKACIKPVKPA